MKRQIDHSKRHTIRVAIVLPERHWAGSVLLVRELLQAAGALASRSKDITQATLFEVVIVGRSASPVASFGGPQLTPDIAMDQAGDFNVVILPAQFGPDKETTEDDEAYGEWLRQQHQNKALVVALGGTLLLAKSGLLAGREATGLVSEAALIRSRFPDIRYQPSRRIIAAADLITVCGVGPTVDACAHLIERFFGPVQARRFLRHTSTEHLPVQDQLALWSAQHKRHGDLQVMAAQELLERELALTPPLVELSRQIGLSERSLSRRFVQAVGLNMRQYVARLRLEQAALLLGSTRLPLIHVARDCGYASSSAMSRAFTTDRGMAPRQFRLNSIAGRPTRAETPGTPGASASATPQNPQHKP